MADDRGPITNNRHDTLTPWPAALEWARLAVSESEVLMRFHLRPRRALAGLCPGLFRSAIGLTLVLALLGVPPRTTQAAPLCVNTTGAGGCFTSIQAAVTAAASGDIITVAAGLYTEAVTIPSGKTLTLRGAQAGVDARTRSIPPNVATESIVTTNPTNSVIFSVQANDVEIDGFTMQGPTSGAAVNSAPTITNIRVLNNITYNLPTGFQ